MNVLVNILKLNVEYLKKYLDNYLKNVNMKTINQEGFLYAKGEIPILLVAHMDTVSDNPPDKIYYDSDRDIIFSDGILGGDDRCGIYAIMEILKELKPHVLFTEGEEIGGIGALTATREFKPKVKYIIEFDRQGSNDAVFYDCNNRKFIDYINSFGFVTNRGTFTDISILSESWDIAGVNISSGYYLEHTKQEYIVFNELMNNINRVKEMLKDYKKADYFDFQRINKISFDNLSIKEILELLDSYKTNSSEGNFKKIKKRRK